MPTVIKAQSLMDGMSRVRKAFSREPDREDVAVLIYDGNGPARICAQNRHIAADTTVEASGDPIQANLSKPMLTALQSIARRSPDAPVSIDCYPGILEKTHEVKEGSEVRQVSVTYDTVTLKARGANFSIDIPSAPISVFPPPPEGNRLVLSAEKSKDVFSLLGDVNDEARYDTNMTGIQFEFSDGTAVASATDGRRMGVVNAGECSRFDTFVLPHRLAKAIHPIISEADSEISITSNDRHCCIATGETRHYGPLDTRRFPALSARVESIRKNGVQAGPIDRNDLRRCLELTKVTTSEPLGIVGVTIESTGDKVVFSSQAPDAGRSRVIHPYPMQAEFKIAVDPSFVIPVLRRIGDRHVTLTVLRDMAIMFEATGFIYVLMGINK